MNYVPILRILFGSHSSGKGEGPGDQGSKVVGVFLIPPHPSLPAMAVIRKQRLGEMVQEGQRPGQEDRREYLGAVILKQGQQA